MIRYKIFHTKSGCFIREFLTLEEAKKCIERMDKAHNEYEPNQYTIKEVLK